MFYVIKLNCGEPEKLVGPGTWEQCIECGLKWIPELCSIVSCTELDLFRQEGTWSSAFQDDVGVYIIQSEDF